MINFDPRPKKFRNVSPQHINGLLSNLESISANNRNGEMSMWETQLQMTYDDYSLEEDRLEDLRRKLTILEENLKHATLMEIPATREQSFSEEWHNQRFRRLTASNCLSACKIGELVYKESPVAAARAHNFVKSNVWQLDSSSDFQTSFMKYGIESEPDAIKKYEEQTRTKVCRTGFWVNPKFSFLGCSPDCLVGDNGLLEIKSLKVFKNNPINDVTSGKVSLPKGAIKKQCFTIKEGKCVLRENHAYYYQVQMQLLVTERDFCDFVLYAQDGEVSVERIYRNESVIAEILSNLTALWRRVLAPEIFEMRVLCGLHLFVLPVVETEKIPGHKDVPEKGEKILEHDDVPEKRDKIPEHKDVPEKGDKIPGHKDVPEKGDKIPGHKDVPEKRDKIPEHKDVPDKRDKIPEHKVSPVNLPRTSTCTSDLIAVPWGGRTQDGIELTNTCHLDNWIMIFQVLLKSNRIDLTTLKETGAILSNALQLVAKKQFGDAKMAMTDSHSQVINNCIDLYGNEDDYFIKLLRPYLRSKVTSQCRLSKFPRPVEILNSCTVNLGIPADLSNNVFLSALNDWLQPSVSTCKRRFLSEPQPPTPCVEDVILHDNGCAHSSWHCSGVRENSERSLYNLQNIFLFSVDLLSRGGLLKLPEVPLSIVLRGRVYHLYGATLWNSGHYISTFSYNNM